MSECRVIFSNFGLASRAGTECFLFDITRALQRRGMQCGIFSPRLGPLTGEFRAAGITVWDTPDAIDWEPDVLHCHHIAETVRLLHRFPKTPAIFMVHEPRLWQGLAPMTPQIQRYVAVDQLCRERLVLDTGLAAASIPVILNGVDLNRFLPRPPLPDKPQRALIFTSGAAHKGHLELARKACHTLGIPLDEAGPATEKRVEHPEEILPHYDLVFAKARCALEAMSVGCPVVLIGGEGLGEMVTSSRFDHLRAMNFGMGVLQSPLDLDILIRQIQRYDPHDAAMVSRRVRTECGLDFTVSALETLYLEVAAMPNSWIGKPSTVSLKATAHLSENLTSDVGALFEITEHLNRANHELSRNMQQLLQAGQEQNIELVRQKTRAEHYRSKVQELQTRIKKKTTPGTVATPSQASHSFSFPSIIKKLWPSSPVTAPKRPPMPFIVGSPRSGTTLLRLMLDAHPLLAIPPETGFIVPLTVHGKESYGCVESFWKLLTGYPDSKSSAWPDFHLKKQPLRDALEKIHPFDSAEGLRVFYRLYASRFKKSRFGDKTPMYARHMTGIEALLPEARFIHIVRDGRDTAVSLRKLWFSPGNTMTEQAAFWRDNVLTAREQGRQVRHYLEVSYEKLVQDPKKVLHEICAFIELPYSKKMLDYHQHAPRRINEHEGRLNKDGTVILSKEARMKQQASSSKALMPELIGRWRTILTASEVLEFEAVAGETLRLYGYETNVPNGITRGMD